MKANKGEWSEFYAFLKILLDRKLFAADKNLDPIPGEFYIFRKIIREETNNEKKIYDLEQSPSEVYITDKDGNLVKRFSDSSLGSKIAKIFEKIKNESETTFDILEASELMNDLLCKQIKAPSSNKADITAIIEDTITATTPELGFSVKSMLGGSSTLLNAGKTTNFIYGVENFTRDIEAINSIDGKSKIRDRLKAIRAMGGELKFAKTESETFGSNLKKIDTVFSQFIAQMLLDFFSGLNSSLKKLTEGLAENVELKRIYGLSISDYEYKMKNFLDSVALGMVPSKIWDGYTQAHGGYIIVKKNGQVVCYHLYNRDEF